MVAREQCPLIATGAQGMIAWISHVSKMANVYHQTQTYSIHDDMQQKKYSRSQSQMFASFTW